jgi:8-oxo-dGTP diphosphatase
MDHKTQHDSETPAVGQQVFTACAFIYKFEAGVPKVFLARRADTKKFMPGIYELPGGHIDYGEDLADGLKREVQEELGVDITVGDVVGVFTYTNEVKRCQSIEVVYFAQLVSPESEITIHPDDHSGFVWCSEVDLTATIESAGKTMQDKEAQLIVKGFELLKKVYEKN